MQGWQIWSDSCGFSQSRKGGGAVTSKEIFPDPRPLGRGGSGTRQDWVLIFIVLGGVGSPMIRSRFAPLPSLVGFGPNRLMDPIIPCTLVKKWEVKCRIKILIFVDYQLWLLLQKIFGNANQNIYILCQL